MELAKALNISRSTAYHIIVKRGVMNDGVLEKPRGGVRSNKVTDEMKNTISDIVNAYPEFTIEQVKQELIARLPESPRISCSTVSNVMVGMLLTMKKLEDARNITLSNNHMVKFLPPYSPFLNIAENAFNLWKGQIKQRLAEVRYHLLTLEHGERIAVLAQLAEQRVASVTPQAMHAAFGGCVRISLHVSQWMTFLCARE